MGRGEEGSENMSVGRKGKRGFDKEMFISEGNE